LNFAEENPIIPIIIITFYLFQSSKAVRAQQTEQIIKMLKENKMRKISWFMIPMMLVMFVLVSADNACAVKNDPPVAPDFTLNDLKGNQISLSEYKGKVLFLNFWATWCPPCRAEIPDFIEVYDEYKSKGLEILGVSVDEIGADKVSKFVERYKMNYPVAMATNELFRNYPPPQHIPTTIVIDRDGKIQHRKVGLMSKQELIDLFNQFSK
jgi:peroxiredoxin